MTDKTEKEKLNVYEAAEVACKAAADALAAYRAADTAACKAAARARRAISYVQEENRKIVIMANNPDAKTYKEALKNELGLGCEFIDDDDNDYIVDDSDYIVSEEGKVEYMGDYGLDTPIIKKIIGKPLMLDRVFIALKKYLNRDEEGHHIEPVIKIETCLYRNVNLLSYGAPDGEKYKLGAWDLSRPLDEQPEDTQLRFNNLLKESFNNN